MTSPASSLEPAILSLREQRVILDADLARIYGVPTRRLNEAVRRNAARFPADFAFRLSAPEAANLKSQSATSSLQVVDLERLTDAGTLPVGTSHGGRRKLPWAFTEHGALMAATVLRSERAVRMSVHVVRAFIRMREELAANATILKRLAEIDRSLLQHDHSLRVLWTKLAPLLAPPPDAPKPRIGFGARVREVECRQSARAYLTHVVPSTTLDSPTGR
jgi:hypothetical protein